LAGDTVAIWGAGKVGNAILQAARTITDNKIFFVDILENRLARSVKAYPDVHTINALTDDPAPVLMKELIWKEARIISGRVSQGEFARAINELSKGNLKPESMITSVVHPSETQRAFELLQSQPEKHLKILLEF
jgi:threonine dehydrogenase-like Zn-dependent dehydrogenase